MVVVSQHAAQGNMQLAGLLLQCCVLCELLRIARDHVTVATCPPPAAPAPHLSIDALAA